jgi:transketolase
MAEALRDRPHRLLALGVPPVELRRYGTPAEHRRAHGLDAAGIRRSLAAFLARA